MTNTARPLLIAEAGNNHEGSLDAALSLVRAAKESGADLVKFQAGLAEGFARRPEDAPRYKKYELGLEGYDYLVAYGKEIGIGVFFSVWWPREFARFWNLPWKKIASRQCNPEMIREHDSLNTFVSIPHTMNVEDVKMLGIKNSIPLHCVTEYPAKDACLGRIDLLREIFGLAGYSDHTVGVDACLAAWRRGACVIEKHFTLAHDFGPLRDHALSATPEEFEKMVDIISGGNNG